MRLTFHKRLIINLLIVFVTLGNTGSVCAAKFNELTFITESGASFNYVQQGKLQGPAVDLLLAVSARVGNPITLNEILVLPWARGYRNAQQGPNMVLFSTIRTPQREKTFHWVGPIASESDVIIALKSRQIILSKKEDIEQYTTGAVRGDIGEDILNELGVSQKKMALVSHSESLGKMIIAGRTDLFIFGEAGWRNALLSADIDPANFEIIYRFEPKHFYFALSQDVDQQLVEQFQQAVDNELLITSKNK